MSVSLSVATQHLLSEVILNPAAELRNLASSIHDVPEEADHSIFEASRFISEYSKQDVVTSPATLVQRLCFAWTLLLRLDGEIRKAKGLPRQCGPYHFTALLRQVLPVENPTSKLTDSLCKLLSVSPDGDFLWDYHQFLAKSRIGDMPLTSPNWDPAEPTNVQRVIRWLVRANRDRYVDVSGNAGQVTIHFPHLVIRIRQGLSNLWGEQPIKDYPSITDEIESQINWWLEYSCLDGASSQEGRRAVEIAKAYIKHNNLKNKVFATTSTTTDSGLINRNLELEAQVAELAASERRLKEEVATLKSVSNPRAGEQSLQAENRSNTDAEREPKELVQVLTTLDAKYSLDSLNTLLYTSEAPFSLRNFIAHLLYCLRKTGLTTYPDHPQMTLTYEESGLFNLIDGNILPTEQLVVNVERKGWAVQRGSRLFPIRLADVAREKPQQP